MKFTVTWLQGPKLEMARLWATAEDPKAVAQEADTIEMLLETDPFDSLTPIDRLYFLRVDRFVILCDVNEAERTVRIIDFQVCDSE